MHTHLFSATASHTTAAARWHRTQAALVALVLVSAPWQGTHAAGPAVPVLQMAAQSVAADMTLEGTLEAVKQSTLSAQANGRIAQLLVQAGDKVRAGQVLAVVDDRDTQAGLERSQAGLVRAQAELRNAETHAQRTRELRNQGFISQSALDMAETQLQSAKAATQQARAGQTQSQLAQGHTRLTAPYDGFVLSTHAEVGDLAFAGKPIVTVYAPQPLRAVTHVPASRAAMATQASKVELQLPDGQWVAPASQNRLPATDPASQTVEWRLQLTPTQAAQQVPGQQIKVRFSGVGTGDNNRLTVPESAVLRRGELTALYVARAAKGQAGFVLRAVRLGASHGKAGVEILSGIKAGDQVALDPVRAGLAGAQAAQ
jgi:RND family efflux transporter MFP subunit